MLRAISPTGPARPLRCVIKRTLSFRQSIAASVLVLASLASSGFLNWRKEEEQRIRFNHNDHIVNYELTCAECHGELQNGRFMKASHDTCIDCHDDWIETSRKTDRTCGQCHKGWDIEALIQREAPEPSYYQSNSLFVHTVALTNRCADCHSPLINTDAAIVPLLSKSEKIDLRDIVHDWNLDCATCHVELNPEVSPPNHDQNWMRRHDIPGTQPDNTCGMCHAEHSCRECHEETMPQSHTMLWMDKTHGVEAAWDRDRCQVCHEPDSCDACHQEVRPRSHNANWERGHCTQCHQSASSGTGCAVCHEVNTIAEHPNPHEAGFVRSHCTSCHNNPSLYGVSCATCHGGNLIQEHPNPHAGNYQRNHCTGCHNNPSLNGVSCATCHEWNQVSEHPNPHSAGFGRTHCTSCHANPGLNGVACSTCHEGEHPNPHPASFVNSHCTTCHQGSEINGVSCAYCHGGDFVESHPNPHPASFRRSHCNSCHTGGSGDQNCTVCHEGGNSVLVHEDFWPPVHDLFGDRANCFDCHY